MKVFILKEGREYNQGVADLDDGTMVVVDNGRRMIRKSIDVVVTSAPADDGGEDDSRALHRVPPGAGRNARPRARRRPAVPASPRR